MPTFDIDYNDIYSSKITFNSNIIDLMENREQRYPKWLYPRRTFTLKFQKNPTSLAQLITFFKSVYGSEGTFDFTWETSKGGNGNTYTCWFDEDSIKNAIQRKGFGECELKICGIDREDIGTIPETLTIEHNPEYDHSLDYYTLIDEVLTAQNARRRLLDTPRQSWDLTFQTNKETRLILEDFFIHKKGKFKSFQWTWSSTKGGNGQTYWVRFDSDELTTDINKKGFGETKIRIKQVFPTDNEIENEKDELIPRFLLDITLTSGNIRILDNDTLEALTYLGDNYLGAPLEIGDRPERDTEEIIKLPITISNVNQVAGSQLIGVGGDKLTGTEVKLYSVFLNPETNELVEDTDSLVFSGLLSNIQITPEKASFDIVLDLGGYESSIPIMTYNSNCQWRRFKDNYCGYTGEETTCDRTLARCLELGNELNFGGFPSIPAETIVGRK